MTGLYVLLGGMAAFATLIGMIDLIGRRQDRRAHHGKP
jgi:hypothetical protein